MVSPGRRFFRKLRNANLRVRLTALVLAIAVTVLFFSIYIIGSRASSSLESISDENLSAANRTLATSVTVWLEIHLNILRNMVSLPDMISMDPKRQKSYVEKMGAAFPYMYLVGSTDLKGRNIARNDNEAPKDYSDREWFQKSRDGEPVAFESLVSKTVGKAALAISMPIREADGRIVGVGMFSLSFDSLAHQVRVTRVGQTGFAYLVDGKNRVIAHPDASYVSELRDMGAYPPVRALREGKRGLVHFTDEAGNRWRAYGDLLENGWCVVVQQLETELLDARRDFERVSWGMMIFAALVLFGATWLGVRRTMRPIEALTGAVAAVSADPGGTLHLEPLRQVAETARSGDEVGQLAERFQDLAVRLDSTLNSLGKELEERKRAQEALAQSRNYLSKIMNTIGDPLFVKDRQHRWVLFNDAFCAFVGYSREELQGRSDADFFPPLEVEVFHRMDDLVFETGQENLNEEPLTDKAGVIHTILTKKTRYTDEQGNHYIVGIISDITERKRMEERILQSQKMETVGLLAGGVAYDFNNMLTPILGFTDMVMATLPEEDERLGQLQQVSHAAERARELTQRLLTFSRKQMITLKTVDLGGIIRKFQDVLRRTIREDIAMEVSIADNLSLIQADIGQIEQVLINLCVNAQDAMPAGGKLTIEAMDIDLDASYTARQSDMEPGAYVMLAVSDTGVGMDQETLDHIFEPFYTTKELGKGTGLGLSTVYGIVKQHGGAISAYTEKGHGSVFKVFLPRVSGETAATPERSARPADASRGQETILVVEDNEMVRVLASEMLEGLGYAVLVADGPDQALGLVAGYDGSIDMVLSDVVMPRMNGKELYVRLREMRPTLRVLFMSGYTSDVIVHDGVVEKDVNFIQKPFAYHTLAEKVRRVLDEPLEA